MGRFLRSVFVVFGIVCLLMNESVAIQGLGGRPVARAALVGFGFAMQMLSVGFILLLQKPFFGSQAHESRTPLNALGVLFGLLLVYPGVSATLIGLSDAGASDAAAMFALGAAMLLTSVGFVFGGLRAILRGLPAPLVPDDA